MPIGIYTRTKPAWNKGIPCSEETRKKMREARKRQIMLNKGENHPMWKGGVTLGKNRKGYYKRKP